MELIWNAPPSTISLIYLLVSSLSPTFPSPSFHILPHRIATLCKLTIVPYPFFLLTNLIKSRSSFSRHLWQGNIPCDINEMWHLTRNPDPWSQIDSVLPTPPVLPWVYLSSSHKFPTDVFFCSCKHIILIFESPVLWALKKLSYMDLDRRIHHCLFFHEHAW